MGKWHGLSLVNSLSAFPVRLLPKAHIEEYNGKSSLKGTLVGFDFVQDGRREQHQEQADVPKSNNYRPPQQQPVHHDVDDLPF